MLIETYALLGRRFGLGVVAEFRQEFAPLLQCIWVSEDLHNAGLDLLLERKRKRLSLVDAVSFVTIRRERLQAALAFDADFEMEGLTLRD